MNLIQQIPSPSVNFSGLTADDTAGPLSLSGVIAVLGVAHPVAASFDPVETPTVYAHADGTVNGDGQGAFAHLAWHDGETWNVITHPAPEPEPDVEPEPESQPPAPEPPAEEPPADGTPFPDAPADEPTE